MCLFLTIKNNIMKKISLIFTLIISTIFLSCSSDDDNNSHGNSELGSVTITLSGDLEGTRTGFADFHLQEVGSVHSWSLSFYDYNPQTFSSSLMIAGLGGVSKPTPGTYEIGFAANDSNVFFGSFVNIENNDFGNAVEYSTFESVGTLTIETSTDERVTGHFEYTAHTDDDMGNISGTINVSGSFDAKKRISLED